MTPANSPEAVHSDAAIENRRPMKIGRLTLPAQRIVTVVRHDGRTATVQTEYGTVSGVPLADLRFIGPPSRFP